MSSDRDNLDHLSTLENDSLCKIQKKF